jgi:molybdenum cofactor synthesis domain-containing protein
MNEMKPFRSLISRKEAFKTILDSVKPLKRTELLPIEKSSGRVLAEEIVADRNVPSFDRSAMDGYAVKAKDVYGASYLNPKTLRVVGTINVGAPTFLSVKSRECVRLATGCPIPSGADAVVMIEFTEERDGEISIFKSVYPGANIAYKGEDMKKGEAILRSGDLLTPAKIGVFAALGKTKALVYEKPRVAVIPTGEEVCEVGCELKEGEVYDINSYTLTSVITENGGLVTRSSIASDCLEELKSVLERFLDHDLIVFSGGSSVGALDILVKVVEETGSLLFHGVQIKPGKPTLYGLVDGKPVLGMPGYPASCLSNAYIFLVPTVRKIARLPERKPETIRVKNGKRIVSDTGRETFLPVKIMDGKAYPVFKKSGDITSLSKADGYIILPINLDVLEEGEEVTVTLFK